MTTNYLDFITSEHRDKPKFIATLSIWLDYCQDIETLINAINVSYDIDEAEGVQLDVVGQIIGASRRVDFSTLRIYEGCNASTIADEIIDGGTANISTDDIIMGTESYIAQVGDLEDDDYKLLLKAKIFKNIWKGSTSEIYTDWENIFPMNPLIVRDNQNMTMDVIVVGFISDCQANLVSKGYIVPKPQAVDVNYYDATLPIFGFGMDTESISGFGKGSWVGFKD